MENLIRLHGYGVFDQINWLICNIWLSYTVSVLHIYRRTSMYQRISDIVDFEILCYLQVLHISSCMLLFLPFFLWLLVAPSMYSYVSFVFAIIRTFLFLVTRSPFDVFVRIIVCWIISSCYLVPIRFSIKWWINVDDDTVNMDTIYIVNYTRQGTRLTLILPYLRQLYYAIRSDGSEMVHGCTTWVGQLHRFA